MTSQGFFVAVGIIYCRHNKTSPQTFFLNKNNNIYDTDK